MSRGLLAHVPNEPELERLYHELAALGAPAVGRHRPWPYAPQNAEELIALAGEMLRYDPRLLSILLELLLARWSELDPMELRRHMQRMRWPQALLVVLEFARGVTSDPELRYWADYLAAGFARLSPPERFFFDVERPGSRMARRKADRSLAAYSRWGFIGTERPTTSVVGKERVGRYDAATRARIRRQLAARRGSFRMQEYLEALDHALSRQQAYADLRQDPDFEVVGHGRGARWRQVLSHDGEG